MNHGVPFYNNGYYGRVIIRHRVQLKGSVSIVGGVQAKMVGSNVKAAIICCINYILFFCSVKGVAYDAPHSLFRLSKPDIVHACRNIVNDLSFFCDNRSLFF